MHIVHAGSEYRVTNSGWEYSLPRREALQANLPLSEQAERHQTRPAILPQQN